MGIWLIGPNNSMLQDRFLLIIQSDHLFLLFKVFFLYFYGHEVQCLHLLRNTGYCFEFMFWVCAHLSGRPTLLRADGQPDNRTTGQRWWHDIMTSWWYACCWLFVKTQCCWCFPPSRNERGMNMCLKKSILVKWAKDGSWGDRTPDLPHAKRTLSHWANNPFGCCCAYAHRHCLYSQHNTKHKGRVRRVHRDWGFNGTGGRYVSARTG